MRSTAQPETFGNQFGDAFNIPLSCSERVQAAAAARHPMLEAARPLLQALRDTPPALRADDVLVRRQWLLSEAKMFERVCMGLKLPRVDADNARYCLCSALDEAAMQTPWGKGETTGTEWSANGLATTLGYDRQGADRVFNLIDSAMRHPAGKGDLLAVLQQIIANGFKGRYRRTPDGARALKALGKNLDQAIGRAQQEASRPKKERTGASASASPAPDDTVDSVFDTPRTARSEAGTTRRGPSADDFIDVPFRMGPSRRNPGNSVQSEPDPTGSARTHRRTKLVGALAVLLPALLLGAGCYGLYALSTHGATPPEATSLSAIADGIRSRLDHEGTSTAVSLNENEDHSRLAIRVDGMFAPGQYALNPAATPPVTGVGHAIAAAPGKVLVHLTGYTDDTPFEKAGGLSNQALSTLRAQSVMQVLATAGVSPERITVSGSGEASPLDDNHTREGRARNRRVEIIVEPLG